MKLIRIRNILDRNVLRKRFRQWVYNAEFIVSIEDALFLTSKTISRRKLRNGFVRWARKAKEIKRRAYVDQKMIWFKNIREKKIQEVCLAQWMEFVKRYKKSKVFLKRSIRGVDKTIQNDAFSTWKHLVFEARKQVYYDNIHELERRQAEHQE